MRTGILTAGIGLALLTFTAGCSEQSEPAVTSSSTPSAVAPSNQTTIASPKPTATETDRGHGSGSTATHTGTHTAPPKATQPRDPYDVRCTGPDQGTICTNPNHGAGTNPAENGEDPTTTTAVRDDDPAGKPCTTGMGVSGVYVYSDESSTWVCQIG